MSPKTSAGVNDLSNGHCSPALRNRSPSRSASAAPSAPLSAAAACSTARAACAFAAPSAAARSAAARVAHSPWRARLPARGRRPPRRAASRAARAARLVATFASIDARALSPPGPWRRTPRTPARPPPTPRRSVLARELRRVGDAGGDALAPLLHLPPRPPPPPPPPSTPPPPSRPPPPRRRLRDERGHLGLGGGERLLRLRIEGHRRLRRPRPPLAELLQGLRVFSIAFHAPRPPPARFVERFGR